MPLESVALKVLLVKVDTAIGFFSGTVWLGTARYTTTTPPRKPRRQAQRGRPGLCNRLFTGV